MDADEEARSAVKFAARLWTAIVIGGTLRQVTHAPGVFDQAWLHELALPIGAQRSPGQALAVSGGFERVTGSSASQRQARARENIDARGNGWCSLASVQLGRAARCQVTCRAYESARGDENPGPHAGQWPGVIVQMRGASTWELRDGQWPSSRSITTAVGDVLLMPSGVHHDVSTPGYSVHLAFMFLADGGHPGPDRSPAAP